MSRIPDGWEYWTSEPDPDAAWRVAIEYKQACERAQNGVFVRVTVIPGAPRSWWILRRIEERTTTHPKVA
jgi:hypothetical protein